MLKLRDPRVFFLPKGMSKDITTYYWNVYDVLYMKSTNSTKERTKISMQSCTNELVTEKCDLVNYYTKLFIWLQRNGYVYGYRCFLLLKIGHEIWDMRGN